MPLNAAGRNKCLFLQKSISGHSNTVVVPVQVKMGVGVGGWGGGGECEGRVLQNFYFTLFQCFKERDREEEEEEEEAKIVGTRGE